MVHTILLKWAAVLALGAVPLLGNPLPQASPDSHPNVVIFLADDLGWNDVGYHDSVIQTPNIDRLAREGTQLDRFYVYPVCSPTRAGLMTARSSMRTGIIYSVVRPWANYGLALDEHLMPQSFHAAGYQTVGIGKWHLGHTHARHFPNQRGFEHYYGHVNGALDYFTHKREGSVDWFRNGKTVLEEGYTTDLLGGEAVRMIQQRDKSRPLFLYMPFNAPHSPMQAPEALIDKYANLKDKNRRIFCAMVDSMDQAIGGVLDALDAEGMTQNTIVLFFSDNGGSLTLGGRNVPLRDGKGSTFEGGIRVPALVRWPAKWKGGRKVSQPMTNLDVFPTLAAAAGVKMLNKKALDGKNMLHAIDQDETQDREDLFFAVENAEQIRLAVHHGHWKLVRVIEKATMKPINYLFRIDEDPNEKKDLSMSNPEMTRDLVARLERWRELHPAGGIRHQGVPHPGWVPPVTWATASGL